MKIFTNIRYIYVIFFGGVIIVILAAIDALLAFIPFVKNKSSKMHRINAYYFRIILRYFFRADVKIIKKYDIERTKPYLIISNHQNMLDIPFIGGYLDIDFRWIAKASLFKIPLIGYSMRKSGYIPIDRSSPKRFYASLDNAAKLLRSGTSILIFPEGHRTHKESLDNFKRGFAYLAKESDVDVLPITINNTERLMPKGKREIHKTTLIMLIDRPVRYSQFKSEDEFIKYCYNIIDKNLQEISNIPTKS